MAAWQYQGGNYKTDQGYHHRARRATVADENNSTAYLECNGNRIDIWLHQITMDFKIGGSFAQSAREHSWYPRNFIAPRVSVVGQTASQSEHGRLIEFIRAAQRKSIDWRKADPTENTTKFIVHSGKGHDYLRSYMPATTKHKHAPYIFFGHVLNVQRKHERFDFAPEFTFEFVITYSYGDVIEQRRQSQATIQKLAPWMGKFIREAGEDGESFVYAERNDPLYQVDPDSYYLKSDLVKGIKTDRPVDIGVTGPPG